MRNGEWWKLKRNKYETAFPDCGEFGHPCKAIHNNSTDFQLVLPLFPHLNLVLLLQNLVTMGRKKILADFKKKTHKVGRKVTPTNQTKIKVKTKKIWLPNQSTTADDEGKKDEKETVLHQLKQLKGQSTPGRITGMQKILAAFTSSETTSLVLETIPALFPQLIELLFDEEQEIRDNCVMTLVGLIAVMPTATFETVAQLLVSSIRSALNNFDKSVRKDSMVLLCEALDRQSQGMKPYVGKVRIDFPL